MLKNGSALFSLYFTSNSIKGGVIGVFRSFLKKTVVGVMGVGAASRRILENAVSDCQRLKI